MTAGRGWARCPLGELMVLIQGGWITALGPEKLVKGPAGAARLDGRGKFLLASDSGLRLGRDLGQATTRWLPVAVVFLRGVR